MRVIGKVVGVQDTAMDELTKGVPIKRKNITTGNTSIQEIGVMISQQNWSTFRALGREVE